MPPKGLFPQELEVWRLLVRPEKKRGVGATICRPYRVKVAGRWAAGRVHPLNRVTDDAEVLLENRRGKWKVISIGTTPAAEKLGIPADVRRKLRVLE